MKLLIIDDEDKLRQLLARIIQLEWENLAISQASDLKSALQLLKQKEFDVIICDVKLPDGNGVDFVLKLKELQPFSEVLLMTAFGQIADGVQAIKNGAYDYITKGDDNHKIIPLLHKAFEKAALTKRVSSLEKQMNKQYSFDQVIGQSSILLEAMNLAKKVSATDTTVLLLGETGTGKEVFAQAIHFNSPRKQKNFIALNCSAISKDLLESELFGHLAGAFTGALKDKKGLFEEANAGTLFLDEIGEMPLELQAKLLRVLETGEYFKVGDSKASKLNVRLIAATNRDLINESEKGLFRADLYYRLSVFSITLPALRERVEDIPLLTNHLVELLSQKMNIKKPTISKEYLAGLSARKWKGNVRELKNVIERSLIIMENQSLDTQSLPIDLDSDNTNSTGTHVFALSDLEKNHIQKVLAYTKGNKAEAARLLGIGIATLYRKIEEYKL